MTPTVKIHSILRVFIFQVPRFIRWQNHGLTRRWGKPIRYVPDHLERNFLFSAEWITHTGKNTPIQFISHHHNFYFQLSYLFKNTRG